MAAAPLSNNRGNDHGVQSFISSTREDLALAQDLARRLEAAGIQVSPVKKAAAVGDKIPNTVNRGLREADEAMIIMTKESGASFGLLTEIGMAYGLKKRVTPVVVNYDPEQLPAIARRQYIKYSDLTKYIAQLAKRVKAQNGG